MLRVAVVLCGAALAVAACKTIGSMPGSSTYNPFFSPSDHLRELTAAGKVAEAGKVYKDQRAYFTSA